MDPIRNPFSPGAGAPPPELVGRDPILAAASVLFARVRQKRAEKSLLLTGLRGVGKTVLLNEIERTAKAQGYVTLSIEAEEGKRLGPMLAPHLRTMLFELDRLAGAGDKVKRGLGVLRSFMGAIKVQYHDVTISLGVDPEVGSADSGDLTVDLPNLLTAVAEAAEERSTAVGILIDEIQYLNETELSALFMGMHRMQQRQLPLVLLGAGLPILPGLAGESKSYAERLFNFPPVGALTESDSAKALRDPAEAESVMFDDDALAEIYRMTKGYPYFLQEWGYKTWNRARTSPISLDVVLDATSAVVQGLDENFFRVRFGRLTPGEKVFLRAMASLGPGPYRTGDVADALHVKVTSIGPRRAQLIKKGMIYSPAHGDLAFTVPLFDEFMKRTMPEFPSRASV